MKDDHKTNKQLIDELTELRSQNAALKKSESEENFRAIFDRASDGILIADAVTKKLLKGNTTLCSMLGCTKEEIKSLTIYDIHPPNDVSCVLDEFEKLLKGEKALAEGLPVLRKNGTIFYADIVSSPITFGGIPSVVCILCDITERKQGEGALRESERRFNQLAEQGGIIAWEVDAQGLYTYVSHLSEAILGYHPDELVGRMHFYDLHPESGREAFKKAAFAVFDRKEMFRNLENAAQTKDGRHVWLSTNGIPLLHTDGTLRGYRGSDTDITDRKRAEEALKEKVEDLSRFATVVSDSNDAVIMHDLDGIILAWNRGAKETYGYTETEALGKNVSNIIAETDREAALTLIQKIKQGDIVKSFELRRVTKDGRILDVWLTTSLLTDEKGKPVAIATTERDITDRKRAEESLRENEERYKALFDRSLDLVYITDFEGRFLDANQAALNRLDYNREEISSLNFATLLSEDQVPIAFQTMQEIIDTGYQKNVVELRLKAKNGNDLLVESIGSVILKDGIPYAIQGIARDITERKRAEKQLKQTLESLKRSFGTTIQVMVSAVETRDPYTAGHQLGVANIARAIATEMGLSQEKIDGIRMVGSIHDIGKLSIPADILSKPSKLSDIEFSMIKRHAWSGYEILKDVESPWPLAEIICQHHERMDGSGYPKNLKGDEILIEARILAVADVVESMASHRPYRPALGINAALEEIEKNKGILYDDAVADACLRLFREKGYQFGSGLISNGITHLKDESKFV